MVLREYSVKRVAELLRGQKEGGQKACLLIGAGASKSAGIGLAADFIAEILANFPGAHADAVRKCKSGVPTYGECMAELTRKQRTDLVRNHIRKAQINWAHVGIALLEDQEYVDRILTTNFDPLVARACALFNNFPAIYDMAALHDDENDRLGFLPGFVYGSAIYHLHGQHTGFVQLNTDDKLEKQAERVIPVIREAIQSRPLIVCGYSGASDPLVRRIADLGPFPYGLVWVCFDGKDPDTGVCEMILGKFDDCYIVRNKPADRFFVELYQELKIAPPTILMQPFDHLAEVFQTLRPYSDVGDGGPDLVDLASQRLARAKAAEAAAPTTSGSELLTRLFAEGEYAQLLTAARQMTSLDEEAGDLASWSAVELGIGLSERARASEGEEAERLFAEAAALYAEALAIRPDKAEALNNWANVLTDRANLQKGAEALRLLGEARVKYAAALAIRPDDAQVICNLANALDQHAMLSGDADAASLWVEAGARYAAALAIKPDMDLAMKCWGNALSHQAERSTGAAAGRLFEQAGEKYRAALAIKPDSPETLENWSSALLRRAQQSDGAEAAALVGEAAERAAAAEALRPGWASYNLACIAGMQGDAPAAAEWLRKGHGGGNFPGCAHLLTDTDFTLVRDHPAFAAALVEIGCSPA